MVVTGSAELPPLIYAEASVRSQGGVSLFETPSAITWDTVPNFYSDPRLIEAAVQQLTQLGFQVQQVSPTTLTIAAPPETYQQVFRTRIVAEERPVIKKLGIETTATFLDCPDTELSGLIDPSRSALASVLEGIAINEPIYYFASLLPPAQSYWHLTVPADISLGLNADLAHRAGYTGRGVRLVMVDSGWYRHPFFIQRGYRANAAELGPAAEEPDNDEHGHGTGESANIFAIAPDVEFTMVKINFVNVIGAFKRAIELRPDIISCSWGSSQEEPPLSAAERALEAAIAHAVRQGITVVVSAGNGHWGFPGQHPDVISAGGTYLHPDGSLEATPYASGFASKIYPNRTVPDVCGLVGMPPRAQYIMLPVEPGNELDTDLSGGTFPEGDQTAAGDGWAAFSGTSAAAPQIAGACALLKQAKPDLTPAQIREILQKTARDVTAGTASPSTGGNSAIVGPDLATGYGLIDVFRAVSVALSSP